MRKPQTEKRAPIVKHEDQYCARLSIALPSLALTQSYPRRLLELKRRMTITAIDRVYAFSDTKVSSHDVREGMLDCSTMIYKVGSSAYNIATGRISHIPLRL